jgi:hypothetical protein
LNSVYAGNQKVTARSFSRMAAAGGANEYGEQLANAKGGFTSKIIKSQLAVMNPFSNKGVITISAPRWKEEYKKQSNPFQFKEIKPEYIKGSKKYIPFTKELGQYIKAKPGKFALGLGLGSAGIGVAGLGLKGMFKKKEQIKQASYIDELQKISKLTDYEKEQNRRVKRKIAENSMYPTIGAMTIAGAVPLFLHDTIGNISEKPSYKYEAEDINDAVVNNIRTKQIEEDLKGKEEDKNKGLNKNFKDYIKKLEKTPFGEQVKPSFIDKIKANRFVKIPTDFAKYQYKDIVSKPFGNKHLAVSMGAGILAGKIYRDVMNNRYKNIKEKQFKLKGV